MQTEPILPTGELLRRAMRHWVTGVAIVTSVYEGAAHGMTVNSFNSISLDPPIVTVTMNHNTRTCYLVRQSRVFGVTVLSQLQHALAERFAGRGDETEDRMAGLDTFNLVTGAPLITGGLAFVDCRVVYEYPMRLSTLFIAEVLAAQSIPLKPAAPVSDGPVAEALAMSQEPLVYFNRTFTRLA